LGLKALGLAKIKKVAPKLRLESSGKAGVDLRTLQGVIAHRYEILARYTGIMKTACKDELARLKASKADSKADALAAATHWLGRGEETLRQPNVRASTRLCRKVTRYPRLSRCATIW